MFMLGPCEDKGKIVFLVGYIRKHFEPIRMYAFGPFCAVCREPLRVHPCSCSSLPFESMSDDAISLGCLRLALGMQIFAENLHVVAGARSRSISPWLLMRAAMLLSADCPGGILVLHALRATCCWFTPIGGVMELSVRDALRAMSQELQCLSFVFVNEEQMACLYVSVLR